MSEEDQKTYTRGELEEHGFTQDPKNTKLMFSPSKDKMAVRQFLGDYKVYEVRIGPHEAL